MQNYLIQGKVLYKGTAGSEDVNLGEVEGDRVSPPLNEKHKDRELGKRSLSLKFKN